MLKVNKIHTAKYNTWPTDQKLKSKTDWSSLKCDKCGEERTYYILIIYIHIIKLKIRVLHFDAIYFWMIKSVAIFFFLAEYLPCHSTVYPYYVHFIIRSNSEMGKPLSVTLVNLFQQLQQVVICLLNLKTQKSEWSDEWE